MNLLFTKKRKQLYLMLVKAFPKELRGDVRVVCNALIVNSCAYAGALHSERNTEWKLTNGEKLIVPYRVYISDILFTLKKMTCYQKIIYHCIFSRSYDGYVRQKHIEALLEYSLPSWAMPYILNISEEYVREIIEIIYFKLKQADCKKYKMLCDINFDNTARGYSRMLSYWNLYYRYDCFRYKDYIGQKLFSQCFGYKKTGQRSINI